jgi:prevent-host-death family protein
MSHNKGRVKKQAFEKLVESVNQAGIIRRDRMKTGQKIASRPKSMRSISITDFRRSMASVLEIIKDSMEPLFITRHGKVVAVLISVKAYLKLEREGRLLRNIARGKQGADKQGKKRMNRLEDLNAGITEIDLQKEVSFGPPVGREVW